MTASAVLDLVRPRHLWRPPADKTYGDEVAGFVSSLGVRLDPEQELALDLMYARRGARWAAMEVAMVVPRQNIKTHTCEMACLADLFLFGGPNRLIIWTAHLFPTANEAFIDLKSMIDRHDWLVSRVSRITEAAGNQGIELVDGTRLKFLARSKSGGRGLSGTKVYLDESFALSPAEVGSLLPTLSAQPDPQVVYASSAGRIDSNVLRSLRDRGRAGDDDSLAYVEWAAEDGGCAVEDCSHALTTVGCVLDDRDRWRQANPAIGRRISEDFVAAERRALPPQEFMRERLGWWEDPPTGATDDVLARWPERANPGAKIKGPVSLGVAVSHDSRSAAIVACGADSGGAPVVDLIDWRTSGTAWLADRLDALRGKHTVASVAVVKGQPAESLNLPDVRVMPAVDFGGACVSFARAVAEGPLSYVSNADKTPNPLDTAVGMAVRKFVGEGWRWSLRESRGDITPLVGAVVALALHSEGDYDPLNNIG